jgi:uncharacterized protein (TIGR02246 family)
MRTRILIGALIVAGGLAYALASAQTRLVATDSANDEDAIQKAMDAYVLAFNNGDLDSVLAGWDSNAEYIDDAGKSIKGRDAMSERFKTALKEYKGSKMRLNSTAIRLLKDDVAIQDGSVVLASANGEIEKTPFTAIWMKSGGRWQLHLVRDLSGHHAENEDAVEGS